MKTTTDQQSYHYVECGLPNVWLVDGFESQDTPYGNGVSIRDLHGLHQCIGKSLCDNPEPLTGPEFRYLRRELDFDEKYMGLLLGGLTARQVRNIETGAASPKVLCDRLIRHVYLESIDPASMYVEEVCRRDSLRDKMGRAIDKMRLHIEREDWASNVAAEVA